MITAKFIRYAGGESTAHEVALRMHTTITGKEDHFHLAYCDAEMIILGMRTGEQDPTAIWRISSIDIGQ